MGNTDKEKNRLKSARYRARKAVKPFNELKFEDITLENYNPQPLIKFEVAV